MTEHETEEYAQGYSDGWDMGLFIGFAFIAAVMIIVALAKHFIG